MALKGTRSVDVRVPYSPRLVRDSRRSSEESNNWIARRHGDMGADAESPFRRAYEARFDLRVRAW